MTRRIGLPIKVTETQPWVRVTYRTLRAAGFDRSVSNYLVAGIALGSGAGTVSFGPPIELGEEA